MKKKIVVTMLMVAILISTLAFAMTSGTGEPGQLSCCAAAEKCCSCDKCDCKACCGDEKCTCEGCECDCRVKDKCPGKCK